MLVICLTFFPFIYFCIHLCSLIYIYRTVIFLPRTSENVSYETFPVNMSYVCEENLQAQYAFSVYLEVQCLRRRQSDTRTDWFQSQPDQP